MPYLPWIAFLIIACFFVPFGLRAASTRTLARRCRAQRALVLTYDDGPTESVTTRLLDLLDERSVRASFFGLGDRVERHPEIAERIARTGHDLGHHTQSHRNAIRCSPLAWARDFAAGRRSVTRAGGSPLLFRPPYGKLTVFGLLQSRIASSSLCWWTIDSGDSWSRRTIDDVADEVMSRGGGVVLMHDGDEYAKVGASGSEHADYVLSLTELLLNRAQEGELRVVPISEVLNGR